MNVLNLEQREEVIALIEKQLMEQHDFAKDSIEPVSLSFASPRFPNHSIDSDILNLIKFVSNSGISRVARCYGYHEGKTK